jgi:integrase
MNIEEAIEQYFIYARVRQLSPDTIRDYANTFRKFAAFVGNVPMEDITPETVGDFILAQDGLSKKTLLNYHINLSALWTWAIEIRRLPLDHVMRRVPKARPEKVDITPYTPDEFKRMLASLKRSRVYSSTGKKGGARKITKYVTRNRAILFLLYDTGLRSSELCNAQIEDLDVDNRPPSHIGGKGGRKTAR